MTHDPAPVGLTIHWDKVDMDRPTASYSVTREWFLARYELVDDGNGSKCWRPIEDGAR